MQRKTLHPSRHLFVRGPVTAIKLAHVGVHGAEPVRTRFLLDRPGGDCFDDLFFPFRSPPPIPAGCAEGKIFRRKDL